MLDATTRRQLPFLLQVSKGSVCHGTANANEPTKRMAAEVQPEEEEEEAGYAALHEPPRLSTPPRPAVKNDEHQDALR